MKKKKNTKIKEAGVIDWYIQRLIKRKDTQRFLNILHFKLTCAESEY